MPRYGRLFMVLIHDVKYCKIVLFDIIVLFSLCETKQDRDRNVYIQRSVTTQYLRNGSNFLLVQ